MNEETKEEHKHEEHKTEKTNFSILGKNKKEMLENLGFIIILISSALFAIGVGLGNFIQGAILLSVFGSLFIIIGIVIYIVSQFIEVK